MPECYVCKQDAGNCVLLIFPVRGEQIVCTGCHNAPHYSREWNMLMALSKETLGGDQVIKQNWNYHGGYSRKTIKNDAAEERRKQKRKQYNLDCASMKTHAPLGGPAYCLLKNYCHCQIQPDESTLQMIKQLREEKERNGGVLDVASV